VGEDRPDSAASGDPRYRLLFERSPVAMAVFDDDGRFAEVNDALCRLLHRSREDLLTMSWQQLVHPDERSVSEAARHRMIDSGRTTHRTERRVLLPDGRQIRLRLTTVPLPAEGGPAGGLTSFEDVTAARELEGRLLHAAMHDSLTGLPNRRLLLDRLSQALARSRINGRDVAVMYLDIDHVKRVNDSLGHEAGDALLSGVAANLAAAVRETDSLARIGGDEFVVVCEEVRGTEEVDTLADRILEAIRTPVVIAGHQVVVTASLGVVTPDNAGVDPRDLLRHADAAMYDAKRSGRSRWIRRRDQPDEGAPGAQLSVESELRGALQSGELALHYQPVVLFDGSLTGFEALVRWQHPTRGILVPDAFLGVAAEGALVRDLTTWVIRRAVQDAASWGDPSVAVSVNVPVDELCRPEFADLLIDLLDATSLPPTSVKLEVLETQLADTSAVLEAMERLVDAGLEFVVDDFGTGYSTFAYLKRLPVAAVKVDRSFVSSITEDPADLSIVRAVIEACRATGRQCVAEGVETPGQLWLLRSLGVDALQGDLIGPAGPLDGYRELIATGGIDLDRLAAAVD
jgi:diguanylate cyclase (GGDEF)-like protein/PAS domain S-box-containing protein